MNDRRSGAILSYIYSITQVVVNLLYVPILLSRIGQTEYGLYQMIGSLIAYLSIIYSIFSGGAVRFYSKYYVLNDEEGMANTLGMLKRLYRIAYPLILFASVVAAGIYIAVYQDTLSSWEIRESCIMIGMLALNLMLSLENTIPTACITAHEKFTFLKLSSILLLIAQPIAIVFLIQWFPFAVTITAVQLTCNFLIVLVQNWYSKYRLGMDTRIRFLDKRLEKQVLTFSGAIVLGSVADQIFWKSDQLILAYFYGADTVAVYAVGSQIVNTYAPLGTAVSSVFMPKISEMWHKEHDTKAMSDTFIKVSRVSLYPLLAVLFGFIVFGHDFIRLWAGEGYDAAYWVAVLELAPFTVDVAQNVGLTILQVMNRYGFRAKMYFMAAVINIGLTVWLAQSMGLVGAAIASGLAMIASSGFVLNWYYQVKVGMDMFGWWRSILREITPMIALCIAGCIIWQNFSGCGWTTLISGVFLWAAAFTLVSYCLCANSYEKNLIRSFIQKVLLKRRDSE